MEIGHRIMIFDELGSTNQYARSLCDQNQAGHGLVVRALFQTKGKGQTGNTWESESGKNLTFSIILHPAFLPPQMQFQLSKVVSLGIIDFLITNKIDAKIKWPNDIYVQNRKMAGILIENSVQGNSLGWCIAGIGLNINQLVFSTKAANPVSMRMFLNYELNIQNIFPMLLSNIQARYNQLKDGWVHIIDKEYIQNMYLFGIESLFRDSASEFEGEICGVSEQGQLLVKTHYGIRLYNFKEISFVN
jgi:BirA family biotin operon repressor/biotin-[acetyl-CoA-carboxylase] ligase